MSYQALLLTIAANVRYYRKQHGLSQLELAEKLDVHLNTISNIERTQQAPTLFMLQRLASAFFVTEYQP